MKIPYFCCIGAELKRYAQDFDFMNQVYLYKVPTDDSIDEVLAEDYFKAISNSVLQDDIVYIYEASAKTLHECRFDKQNGHITAVPLASDETLTGAVTSIIHDNLTPNKLLKSDENGKVAASDFSENDFVKKSGDTMTGDLAFKYSASYPTLYMHQSATTPDRLVLYKGGVSDKTIILDLAQSAILLEKLHTTKINNGHDIAVPVTNSPQTLALKSEVDLAANSGRMITDQGVWFAKMYAASTVPTGAEYDGKNYADFSQVDSDNNPVIKIYTGASGSWTLTETITPPAEYDGYVPITSKIWDIPEQAGQQGGRILWNHQSKDFTPYPQIISFKNAALTGTSTAPTPTNSSPNNQIANKEYVDNATANSGSGLNVGDIFLTMRNDSELNGAVECNGATYNTTDFIGAQSIGALLVAGKIPYVSLADYATALATNGSVGAFGWDGGSTTAFRVPLLNDIFIETGTATQIGDYLKPGLPDHTHTVSTYDSTFTFAGGTYGGLTAYKTRVTSAASESNPIYGNSTTVQPNAVRYRAMVQLATGATDEALETCTAVTAQVATNTAAIADADYVIESQTPTTENNYTWYRKYKSGWVEQGGYTSMTDSVATIALPITMSDTNYTLLVFQEKNIDGQNVPGITAKTASSFSINPSGSANGSWRVSGVAAS